jgi:hypothetical protein
MFILNKIKSLIIRKKCFFAFKIYKSDNKSIKYDLLEYSLTEEEIKIAEKHIGIDIHKKIGSEILLISSNERFFIISEIDIVLVNGEYTFLESCRELLNPFSNAVKDSSRSALNRGYIQALKFINKKY